MEIIVNRLKKFDVFRELPSDLAEPSPTGGAVSIAAILAIFVLFVSEFSSFVLPETRTTMYVNPDTDAHTSASKMMINMDITLPALPCSLVSVDSQDVMGSHQLNVGGELIKTRLSKTGKQLSKESFLPAGLTPKSLEKMKGEGCRVHGSLKVKKVPGNFHISDHAHPELQSTYFGPDNPMNCSHIVHHLSFGEPVHIQGHRWAFSPLDGLSKMIILGEDANDHALTTSFEYYIKVVPTIFEELSGQMTDTYQFTASSNALEGHFAMPAIYFRYDLSPITVHFSQTRVPFTHFLVQVCAIIGGVFTVLGLVSQFIHRSVAQWIERTMQKAREGKLG